MNKVRCFYPKVVKSTMAAVRYLSPSIVAFVVMFSLTLAAYAADTGTAVVDLFNAIKVGTLSAILIAVGQLLKSDLIAGWLNAKVNSKFIPWITVVVGIVISVGHGLSEGKVWYMSALEGLIAALLSNGIFDQTKPLQS